VPETPKPILRRRRLRRAIPAGVVAVLVVGGIAVVRTNASASPLDTYRTTTVTTGSLEQRLDLTGSVQRVNQVSQSFAVNGTVSSVSVAVGDNVKAGQALATLDPGPLGSAITAAEATLAQAKATLESDEVPTATSTTSTGVTQASTPTTSSRAANSSSSGRSGAGAGANQSLARAQRGLATAQGTVAGDLQRASAALALCSPFYPSAPSPSAPSPSDSPTSPPTTAPPAGGPTPTTTATTLPSDAAIKACVDAIRTAPTQQQIQRDQKALTRSQAELITAITLAITTAGNTPNASVTATSQSATSQSATSQSATSQSATSQSSGGQSSGGQSSGGQSSGGRTGGTSESSAARLASDQGAVTSAEAAVSSAQADLASATLKSSIVGTVGSVSLVNGASSAGENITIVGAGAVEVTVNVPLASMSKVRAGQKANVTPSGATSPVPGAVTSISLLPSTTATGTAQGTATSPAYPVVVLVRDALPALASGSRAQVSLLIGTAGDVLTVPNSALTPLGNGQALALTFKDGVTTRALVKTGYAGTLTTQVTSGLVKGQQVVLADLSTALPTNTTNARRFGVGGGAAGGLGGAGIGGAGIGGAGIGGAGIGGAGIGGAGIGGVAITGRTGFTPGG
jgi:multidrug efflux pump subunit AcrA (membrane-fusion protein)